MEDCFIIIVDDDRTVRRFISHVLQKRYKRVVEISSAVEALKFLKQINCKNVVCIISDVHMPVMSGLDFFFEIKKRWVFLLSRFIFITGEIDEKIEVHAKENNIPVFKKPFNNSELVKEVENICHLSNQNCMSEKKLFLIVIDRDNHIFNVLGPLEDDTDWLKKISQLKKTGRDIICFSSEIHNTIEEVIKDYRQRSDYSFSKTAIITEHL